MTVSTGDGGVALGKITSTVSARTMILGIAVGCGLGVSDTAATTVAVASGVAEAIGVGTTSVAVGRLGTMRVLVGVGIVAGPPGRHWIANNPATTLSANRKPSLPL